MQHLRLPWQDVPGVGPVLTSPDGRRRVELRPEGVAYLDAVDGSRCGRAWREFEVIGLDAPTLPSGWRRIALVVEALSPKGFPLNSGEFGVSTYRDGGLWVLDQWDLGTPVSNWYSRSVIDAFDAVATELGHVGDASAMGREGVLTGLVTRAVTGRVVPGWLVRKRVRGLVRQRLY